MQSKLMHFILLETGNKDDFNRTHVTLKNEDDVEDAILIIEHAELTDRNYYNCTARNLATGFKGFEEDTDGTYVRVKGNEK